MKQLFAALILCLSLATVANAGPFGPGFGPHPGPGFGPRPGFGPGPGYWRGPVPVGPIFRPGPGWRPGFPPPPGYFGPGFPVPAPGYVFTCFAQNNFGQYFYQSAVDPNFAQAQAMNYCYQSGGACVATGCR